LARFANSGANKELFSAMGFISPASCPKGVVTRSLRNYVECGGLTPLSAAQLDATQVARGGSGALGSKSSATERLSAFSVSIVTRNAGFAVRANHEAEHHG
jgi:hypothetical protein